MDPDVKKLIREIEDKEEIIRNAKDDISELKKLLEALQEKCEHDYPEKWEERPERDYRLMSPGVCSALRRDTPEIVVVQFKCCKKCGKEMTGKTIR